MMDFGHPQTTESKILQELVAVNLHVSISVGLMMRQIHHARVTQARSPSKATYSSHKCR
jgi:hypothetical protein